MPDEQFRSGPGPVGEWANRPADKPDYSPEDSVLQLKHSKLGLIAVVIGCMALLLFFAFIATIVVMVVIEAPKNSPVLEYSPALWIGAGLLGLIGTVLAVIALALPNRKKLYAWVGLTLNLMPLMICTGIFCIAALLAFVGSVGRNAR
jgi:hypothetical protein